MTSVENVSDIVDFEDLTVLLANWNRNVATAEGNLVNPVDTPVNFDDLTVLLAAWTVAAMRRRRGRVSTR